MVCFCDVNFIGGGKGGSVEMKEVMGGFLYEHENAPKSFFQIPN